MINNAAAIELATMIVFNAKQSLSQALLVKHYLSLHFCDNESQVI